MNYSPLCNELEKLIKQKIKDEGLVNSGKMLNSIVVTYNGSGFSVSAVDYFYYLNEEHKIIESVVNSSTFKKFTEDYISKEIKKEIISK